MQLDVQHNCPLNNFSPCKKLECAWFTKIVGLNPQTGQQVDEFGCAVAWMPMLMIENSQMQRQTGAAVESFRNEMVNANQATLKLMQHKEIVKCID